jgi:hypothetical protein
LSDDRGSPAGFRYRVVRDLSRPGFADIALVRETPGGEAESHGLLARLRHRDQEDAALVLHHRVFKPMLELAAMEAYAAQLELAAEHGNDGTLGCFVQTRQTEDGTVDVTLWERWFDGSRLHCEQLAERAFDAGDDDAVVASSEFLAEIQAWAQDRNDEREAQQIDDAAQEQDRSERASERAENARQLAAILASHGGRPQA